MRTLRFGRALALIALVFALASCKTGTLGVTNFDSITLSEDLVVGDDVAVTGDLTVTGAVAGAITTDLNGSNLVIDATGNTGLRATQDNLPILTLGGTPTAAAFRINTSDGTPAALFRGGAGNSEIIGNLKVGNGANSVTMDGEDAYVEGTFEVDGAANIAGILTLGSDPVLGTGAASAGEVADVVRYVNLPLGTFIDCQTDAGALLGFDTTADTLADYVNSATDGTGFVLRFDDTGSSEDQSSEVCTQLTVPADYVSGGAFRIRALKDAHTAATEVLNCAVSVNGAALEAAGTTTTSASATTSYACTPTIAALAANDSLSFYLSITSDSTMNDLVDIASVAFFYTATQ